jgi:hypothetical protein
MKKANVHFLKAFLCLGASVISLKAEALVYCITNSVDVHQQAPTGMLAQSGWQQTVKINNFLATIIHSNALISAAHLLPSEMGPGDTFTLDGVHTLTEKIATNVSDLAIHFFTPPITNSELIARLNIESDIDTNAFVVLQGCGRERGDVVTTSGSTTNGWKWGSDLNIRRWGVNHFFGATEDGLCALATFDNNGNPDECMLSPGDSGGPGFLKTGSGWKLAMVNYSVYPSAFSLSTNPVSAFNASLYDCAGLYYEGDTGWTWVSTNESPSPCFLICSRTSQRLAWLTNTIPGLTFPSDLGLSWRVPTNQPTLDQALNGFWMEVILTNAGPYSARNVTVDLEWAEGLLIKGSSASHGTLMTNQWSLPLLQDGCCATLHVESVVWTDKSRWSTNRAVITAADKPDENIANNEASMSLLLPATKSTIILFL